MRRSFTAQGQNFLKKYVDGSEEEVWARTPTQAISMKMEAISGTKQAINHSHTQVKRGMQNFVFIMEKEVRGCATMHSEVRESLSNAVPLTVVAALRNNFVVAEPEHQVYLFYT